MADLRPGGLGASTTRLAPSTSKAVVALIDRLLPLLKCPACDSALVSDQPSDTEAALRCRQCGGTFPIIDSIPRFVDLPHDEAARRTQESFGYEWTHFSDWRQSGETNFTDYFKGVDFAALRGKRILDAGCGMGRHARQVARYAAHVVAVDFSRAIDQALRNSEDLDNVDCLQADLLHLPLKDEAFDFVYSLGVLHHLRETEIALAELVKRVRTGGTLRIYLYWKRHGWQGRLLSLVTATRKLTTRMPLRLLRVCCLALSVVLCGCIILPYRLLSILGARRHENWPLFVYTKYPFQVLYNDQFDRFSAPIEKRYDANEVRRLLEAAGLGQVSVWACYGWVAEGSKL